MNEPARRIFHIFFGTALAALAYHEIANAYNLLALLAVSIILSEICIRHRIPIIHPILEIFEREENLKAHPGIGAIAFLTGSILALILFTLQTATAAILILSFGDGISGLIGPYGKTHIHNPKKKIEGTIAGIIAASAAAATVIAILPAVIASSAAMLVESFDIKIAGIKIDDNLIIPILSGAILSLL